MGKGSGNMSRYFKEFRDWLKENNVNFKFSEQDFKTLALFQLWAEFAHDIRVKQFEEEQKEHAKQAERDLEATPNVGQPI